MVHTKRKHADSPGIRFAALLAAIVVLFSSTITGLSQVDPTSPTLFWVPILYGPTNFPDASEDQQTGSSEGDLVGDLNNPSLYLQFDGTDLSSSTDGWLAFRLRVGADANPAGFKGAAFIGLDANLDGILDLFIGVNNKGSSDELGLWNPGSGLNNSPSTTSILNSPVESYAESAANYSFAPVNTTIDPTGTSFDLDGGGRTDYFLSFAVPFSDVVDALAAMGITGFNEDSPLQLIAATATQGNSLNQDLNGVVGGVNSDLTWIELGAFSLPYAFNGTEPVPEPSPTTLCCLAGGLILIGTMKRRSRV